MHMLSVSVLKPDSHFSNVIMGWFMRTKEVRMGKKCAKVSALDTSFIYYF